MKATPKLPKRKMKAASSCIRLSPTQPKHQNEPWVTLRSGVHRNERNLCQQGINKTLICIPEGSPRRAPTPNMYEIITEIKCTFLSELPNLTRNYKEISDTLRTQTKM